MSLRIRKYIGVMPFFRTAVANGEGRASHKAAQPAAWSDSATPRQLVPG